MSLTFEWDPEKDQANVEKHGIDFQEATSAFFDPLSLTIRDPDHSESEERFLLVGMTRQDRLVVVSHTDREDRIRIISARRADRRERKNYEGA